MPNPRLTVLSGLLIVCAILALSPWPVAEVKAQPLTRTAYVTVTEKDGPPVTDLKAEEFEVKYAGKVQEISGVKLATTPLRVALVVADRGTGIFQLSALRFVEALLGRGEFSITGVVVQPERYVDYSGDVNALRTGLIQLQKRGAATRTGAQIVEAIVESIKDVPREGYRPVIVVMHAGGEGPTPIRAAAVREDLRKSGARLYAVSRGGTQGVGGGSPTSAMSVGEISRANANAEQAEGSLTLGTIMGDGSKDSGGRYLQPVATSLVPTMQQIAAELLNQYEITYVIPSAGRPSDRLEVSVKRKGLTVAAPTRVPN